MINLISTLLSQGFMFFALHLKKTGSFPPSLSQEEEQKCLIEFKNGDLNAKNKIIEHNLRLVAHIVKKYSSNQEEQDDLISVGTIGLIKGVNTFDESKGIKLATYASKCIENEILMYFRSKKKSAQDVSVNEPIDSDSEGNPLTLMDIICAEDDIAEKTDDKINIEKIYKHIGELKNEREKTIIIMRYGLYDTEPFTQIEIAEMLDISRSYVSRIEKKVIEKLRSQLTDNVIKNNHQTKT